MCGTCGCGDAEVRVVDPETGAVTHTHDGVTHTHGPDAAAQDGPSHTHEAGGAAMAMAHGAPTTVELELDVLAKNDALASRTRARLAASGVVAVNLMSSPGSGKTTLLERTIRELGRVVSVVEGDQETVLDAERIRAAGARAVQVNTGSGCHLDAEMLGRALDQLAPQPGSLVMVENVGNLVCPALFDLGEAARVVVISVTEGDDKPLKYPHMFTAADVVVVNKADLLPYVDFDVDVLAANARRLRPDVPVLTVSARTGDGMTAWYEWVRALD